MAFKLSPETRDSIARSTGMSRTQQTSTPISGVAGASGTMTANYSVDKPKDIAPRGSIYLQMNLSHKGMLRWSRVQKWFHRINDWTVWAGVTVAGAVISSVICLFA